MNHLTSISSNTFLILSLLIVYLAHMLPQPSSAAAPFSSPKPFSPPKPLSPQKPLETLPSPSPAPAPAKPKRDPGVSILNIVKKSGNFAVLFKLLRDTHVGDEINSQLEDNNDGITFFAPTDVAFSDLKAGTLNSLTSEQQVQLMLFHVVPTYLPQSQFQTVSNPLITKAGGAGLGEFPLNVTMYSDKVVVSTGVNSATIDKTLFSDGRLVVYQVGKVLLPLNLFASGGSYAHAPVAEMNEKPDDGTSTLATSAERKRFSSEVWNAIVGFTLLVVSSNL